MWLLKIVYEIPYIDLVQKHIFDLVLVCSAIFILLQNLWAIKTCTIFDQVVIDIQHVVKTVGPKSEETTEFVGTVIKAVLIKVTDY